MRTLTIADNWKDWKFGDTDAVMTLTATDDGKIPDFGNKTLTFKIANTANNDLEQPEDFAATAPGYINGNAVQLKTEDVKQLTPGNYVVELWVMDNDTHKDAIYPSKGFAQFTIEENSMKVSDITNISSMTLNAFWDALMQKVSTLTKGAKGDPGQTPKIVMGSVTKLSPDAQPSATLVPLQSDPNTYTLNLQLPQGAQGEQGLQGIPGVGSKGLDGSNGLTPTIDPKTKHWMIGGTDTGVIAEGQAGKDADPSKYVTIVSFNQLRQQVQSNATALAQKAGKFELEDKLDQMNLQPEMYADLNAVNAAYPNGATKLIATDDGYLALYRNGQWVKGPLFQAAGIGDNSVGSKQVSTISASKIVDNQLSPSEAEGQGNINVVGNNEYVMITSNEVQTAANLVGAFIPLIITSKAPLILTANVTSSLDAGYTQTLWLADKNKTVLRQLGNVAVPDKSTAINVKESLKITEDPGNYYLLITSKAVGTVTYRNLTINAGGSPASTVADEISELNNKIEELPSTTKRTFDTIINNNVQLDKVSATDGIELTRDVNTITAKVNKAHSAEGTQAIFFPVHVQNRNAEFIVTVKVAPIKFSETYAQQIYLADAERNLGEPLGAFLVNSQTSDGFKVNLPASQDFCIALIASVTGTFEFELTVNDSTGRNVNLEEYTTWLDSGTYDHARMDISRINYPSLTAKTIDGVEYVSPYHTFGVDNGRLNAIYVWTEKAGTYSFCVGKLDQNNLIVDGKYFDLELAKGFNSIGVNIRTDAASNLFMKITDGVSLYEGNQAIKVQTSGQHINSGVYSGDYFQDNHGVLPFGYDVTSLSPTDRIKTIEDQQRQNTASIAQLQGATVLTASNGVKYKLMVANDGTLSTKNMTPNKVRVFGNSLTATHEGFGLAASDPQHDYYYLMSQYILGKNPEADIQRQGMVAWEWSTNSSDRQKAFNDSFKPYLDADTDLVIVQCMENVGTTAAKQTLAQDSVSLLQNIKKCSPDAQIIWMYGWWGDHTVFDPAQNACDKVGAKGINLNDIGTQKSMQSYAGQKRTLKDGTVREIKDIEASHPGDAGMQAIADRLIANFDF